MNVNSWTVAMIRWDSAEVTQGIQGKMKMLRSHGEVTQQFDATSHSAGWRKGWRELKQRSSSFILQRLRNQNVVATHMWYRIRCLALDPGINTKFLLCHLLPFWLLKQVNLGVVVNLNCASVIAFPFFTFSPWPYMSQQSSGWWNQNSMRGNFQL